MCKNHRVTRARQALLALIAGACAWVGAADAGPPPDTGAERATCRLESVRLELGYSRPRTGTSWSEDFDRGWRRSGGLELAFESEGTYRRGRWEAGVRWGARLGEHLPSRGRLLEGWLALHSRHLRLLVGRASIAWGPAMESALLISHNASPLDQLRITGSLGHTPGLGGQLTGETFVAYLDDPHRELPYPLLCGMRGTWHATSWLDIGAQRTILLGGGGRTQRLTVEDLWQILTGQGEGEAGPAAGPEHYAERDTDQKFAWQIDVHPRAWARRCGLHDLEAFWLYAGEDRFNGLVPMAPARSFGVRVHPTERLAASFVHVKTVDDLNFWYHHKVYVDGYSYHGVIMGHPMGGDAERWACGLFASPDGEQILSVRLVRERRGFFRDGRGLTAGGFWMWIIGVEAPGPGVQLAADLGATWAWGGDRESDRLAEGFARVSIVWPRRASLAIDRARLWGTAE